MNTDKKQNSIREIGAIRRWSRILIFRSWAGVASRRDLPLPGMPERRSGPRDSETQATRKCLKVSNKLRRLTPSGSPCERVILHLAPVSRKLLNNSQRQIVQRLA